METQEPAAEAAVSALDAYLCTLERGGRPDRAALLEAYPQLASHLACLDELQELTSGDPDEQVTIVGPASSVAAEPGLPDFGLYEVEAELGRGGMGVVYRARERGLNRRVALKMILSGQLASPEHRARFATEARAAAGLQHPNIVPLLQAGELQGLPYLAMQYIDGPSLAGVLAAGPLPCERAVRIVLAVARAIEHLHRHDIVHRDLKPSNILLDREGHPYVTDFGLAKMLADDSTHTQTGVIIGTPSYMAPEQAAGSRRDVGPACDIYGLGAILYETLAGRPPFREATPLDTLVQVLEGEPPSLRTFRREVPRDLERICLKCLEKAPEDRYASAEALAADLERFLAGETVEALPPTWWARLVRWGRRAPALVSRLVMIGICLLLIQVRYHFAPETPRALHLQVMALFGLWGAASWACQQALNRPAWGRPARVAWALLDVGLLNGVILLDGSVLSPVAIGYPLLIAGSGLWFRIPFVWFTTLLAILSYALFLTLEPHVDGMHRHLIFMVGLVLLGFMTAYQVQRVRALSRFYERRPLP